MLGSPITWCTLNPYKIIFILGYGSHDFFSAHFYLCVAFFQTWAGTDNTGLSSWHQGVLSFYFPQCVMARFFHVCRESTDSEPN